MLQKQKAESEEFKIFIEIFMIGKENLLTPNILYGAIKHFAKTRRKNQNLTGIR
jgi:hypothetical protein